LISIYPACRLLGVVGGQVAALLAIIVSYLLQLARLRQLTGLNLFSYGKALAAAGLVSGGILAVGLSARVLGFATRPVPNIALGAGACLIAYALSAPALIRLRQSSGAMGAERRRAIAG
jgi:hypothetical protein